jgi:Kef-type K+ transport system membrane component KefB
MFTAGLDVKLSSLRRIGKKSLIIALLNGLLPFAVGYSISHFFGYNLLTSLILGAIFMSSSVAIIIPSLKESKLAETDLGKTIISATVFEDTTSLLILAFLLKYASGNGMISFPVYVPLVLFSLVALFFIIPKLQRLFIKQQKETQKEDIFEGEFKFIIFVLILTALLFELLGLHAAIAGFFVGLFLSDAIKGRIVFEKIYTVSYGIFIPIFFLVIGMQTDIIGLFAFKENLLITGVIVSGLIFSKFFSGWLAGLLSGHSKHDSFVIAASSIPQLSTTLVVALAAAEFGLFDQTLLGSIVVLSVVTTLFAPFMIRFFHKRIKIVEKEKSFERTKKTWGVTTEKKMLKKHEQKVKQKEKIIKKSKQKQEKQKQDIKKKKVEIKKIKKVIRKKQQ